MGDRERIVLAVGSLTFLGLGSGATFTTENGTGSASLVIVGAAAALLAAIGRWPRRIGGSNLEADWGEAESSEAVQRTLAGPDEGAAAAVQLAVQEIARERQKQPPVEFAEASWRGSVLRTIRFRLQELLDDSLRIINPSEEGFSIVRPSDKAVLIIEAKDGPLPLKSQQLWRMLSRTRGYAAALIEVYNEPAGYWHIVSSGEHGNNFALVSWSSEGFNDRLFQLVERFMAGESFPLDWNRSFD